MRELEPEARLLVAEGRIHYLLGGGRMGGSLGGSDAAGEIAAWVAENFTAASVGGATVYDLPATTAAGTGTAG